MVVEGSSTIGQQRAKYIGMVRVYGDIAVSAGIRPQSPIDALLVSYKLSI